MPRFSECALVVLASLGCAPRTGSRAPAEPPRPVEATSAAVAAEDAPSPVDPADDAREAPPDDPHQHTRRIVAEQVQELEKLERAHAKTERARLLDLELEARAAHEAWARDLPDPPPQ